MISIDKFPAFNGNPPGVAVRFTYIEPTHEVIEALTRAGINATSAFRSVGSRRELTTYRDMNENQIDHALDLAADWLLCDIGRDVLATQTDKLIHTEEDVVALENAS